jgi:hypothetical protein
MQETITTMSFRNEHVLTTTKKLEVTKRVELTTISCILALPIEFVEVLVVVVSTRVEKLK